MGGPGDNNGDSEFPAGLFSEDGGLDLGGFGVAATQPFDTVEAIEEAQPGDAWSADRNRRSTIAPPSETTGNWTIPAPASSAAGEALKSNTLRPEESAHKSAMREIVDRYALGDFQGALSAAELELGRDPDNEQAREYADSSRQHLEGQYASRIGSLEGVYGLAVAQSDVKWLGLDRQASFLLTKVNGVHTVGEVLHTSGLDRLTALKIFVELLEAKAIHLVG